MLQSENLAQLALDCELARRGNPSVIFQNILTRELDDEMAAARRLVFESVGGIEEHFM